MSTELPYRPRHSLFRAFACAGRGLREFLFEGRNAVIQVGCAMLTVMGAFAFGFSVVEWTLLTLTIGTVLGAEAMNTAVERLVDLVSPEFNPLAGRVKDLAAAAVLIVSIMAVIVGLLLFVPKLLELSAYATAIEAGGRRP